jgi:putative PIN family toxin of toxin-antitoxin system
MRIVLDTNILLVSFSSKSEFYWIWISLLERQFTLCVTTDILLEYEEVIARHVNPAVARNVLDAITDLPNLEFVTKYIFWQLIDQDTDDNKFVDCAIACNAKYLVSEDKHFKILETIPFPKVELIGIDAFKIALETES